MSTWPWVRIYDWSGVSIEGLPHLQRWVDELAERPACQKGIVTPPSSEMSDEDRAKEIRKMVSK
jgi:GST-like protein